MRYPSASDIHTCPDGHLPGQSQTSTYQLFDIAAAQPIPNESPCERHSATLFVECTFATGETASGVMAALPMPVTVVFEMPPLGGGVFFAMVPLVRSPSVINPPCVSAAMHPAESDTVTGLDVVPPTVARK